MRRTTQSNDSRVPGAPLQRCTSDVVTRYRGSVWKLNGQVGPHSRSGADAEGWLWEIQRGETARRVLVEVTRTALAVRPSTLPGDTEAAITTEGHSEVTKLLQMDDPPRVVTCGTAGCNHRTAEDLQS